jgi:uncharacterized protein YbjQ (UPF0145 family)
MLIVTTENVPNHVVRQVFGPVYGITVRSRGVAGNFIAGLRTIFGGEIVEYTQMVEDARRQALDRLSQNAHAMGANAVVMTRYDSSEISDGINEVFAYGTAVWIDQVR